MTTLAERKAKLYANYQSKGLSPKEFKKSSDYINKVVKPLMKELCENDLADAVDIFHEEGYFTTEDTKSLFNYAESLNLKCKI